MSMIAYAIEVALKSNLFDEVMVSTEDSEIAKIAKKYNAKIPFMRSQDKADDYAAIRSVALEVIHEYEQLGNYFDTICLIYPCVPLLSVDTLIDAYKQFDGYDALTPVCPYPVPFERALVINDDWLTHYNKDTFRTRTQDSPTRYFDTGMFYFIKTDVFKDEQVFISSKTKPYLINPLECQDIDEPHDWHIAELKYKILNQK